MNRALASKLTLNGLIWGRMTFGAAAWLAPRPVGYLTGFALSGVAAPEAVWREQSGATPA